MKLTSAPSYVIRLYMAGDNRRGRPEAMTHSDLRNLSRHSPLRGEGAGYRPDDPCSPLACGTGSGKGEDPSRDLEARLRRIIREEFESLMTSSYEHGYNAGRREVLRGEIDRDSYRRGYHSGYHAARTGTPEAPDPKPRRRRRANVSV